MSVRSRSRSAETLPKGWVDARLRFLCRFNPSKSEVKKLSRDTEVSFVPMERISTDGDFDLSETKPLESVYDGFTYFRDGDVLVAKITPCFENGKGGIAKKLTNSIGFGTTEFHVLRPVSIDGHYLEYLCRSYPFRSFGELEMLGSAGQKRVTEDYLQDEIWPIPPPFQQTAIARFLDRETAKIDALIAKEERLLGLLEEKRTALISHAVTKGLDPNAELNDSGIEWLGRIPKGWEVKKLKYCSTRIKTGGTPPSEYIVPDGELDWYTPGDFDGSLFLDDSARRLASKALDDGVARFFPAKSILIVGIGATLGKVALCRNICSANQQINFVVPAKHCSPEFLFYFLSLHRETMRLLSDSATLGIMNQEKTGLLPVPAPPLDVQAEIVFYIQKHTARFDALKSKINRAIGLLREKRTALISAAVTGKIEVEGVNK